jgi:hypothetical protein
LCSQRRSLAAVREPARHRGHPLLPKCVWAASFRTSVLSRPLRRGLTPVCRCCAQCTKSWIGAPASIRTCRWRAPWWTRSQTSSMSVPKIYRADVSQQICPPSFVDPSGTTCRSVLLLFAVYLFVSLTLISFGQWGGLLSAQVLQSWLQDRLPGADDQQSLRKYVAVLVGLCTKSHELCRLYSTDLRRACLKCPAMTYTANSSSPDCLPVSCCCCTGDLKLRCM